jgi:hypothetical protein
MVNTCEPLINVVRTGKPKMLIGLGQKACDQEKGLSPLLFADEKVTGEQAEPNPFADLDVERGKPVVLLSGKVNRKANQ